MNTEGIIGGFQPGNKLGKGRPKKLKTQVKDFIKEHPYAVETLMKILYEKGIAGDRECAMYIIDRIKGKPKATLGIAEEDKDLLTAATVLAFRRMMDAQNLLKEGSQDAIQGQGAIEGSFKEINGEEEEGVNIRG